MGRPLAITSLRVSPEEDRQHRIVMYTVTMGIRVVCVFGAFFAPGWWGLLCLLGAVVLPYIAVVLANVAGATRPDHETPGRLSIPSTVPDEWTREPRD